MMNYYIRGDNLKLQDKLNRIISKMVFNHEDMYKTFLKIQAIQNTYDDKRKFINNLLHNNIVSYVDYSKLTLLNDFFEGDNKEVQIQCLRKVINSYK